MMMMMMMATMKTRLWNLWTKTSKGNWSSLCEFKLLNKADSFKQHLVLALEALP
jgi:hypothetical protein